MKVVLLKDIRNVGRAHTVLETSDGHAINFLIPQGLATRATPATLKIAEHKVAQQGERRTLEATLIRERVTALAEGVITITKKANDQGHLYDKVDAKDIAEAAELPVDVIALDAPIKSLGRYDVAVSSGENFGTIAIDVVAE